MMTTTTTPMTRMTMTTRGETDNGDKNDDKDVDGEDADEPDRKSRVKHFRLLQPPPMHNQEQGLSRKSRTMHTPRTGTFTVLASRRKRQLCPPIFFMCACLANAALLFDGDPKK